MIRSSLGIVSHVGQELLQATLAAARRCHAVAEFALGLARQDAQQARDEVGHDGDRAACRELEVRVAVVPAARADPEDL